MTKRLDEILNKIDEAHKILATQPDDVLDETSLARTAKIHAEARQRLELLHKAELKERQQIADKEIKQRNSKRHQFFIDLAQEVDNTIDKHDKFTQKAIKLIQELVDTLEKRFSLWAPEKFAISDAKSVGLITRNEEASLLKELGRSRELANVDRRAFFATWRNALNSKKQGVQNALDCIPRPEKHYYLANKPLSPLDLVFIKQIVASKSEEPYPASETPEEFCAPEKPSANTRHAIDLRPPSKSSMQSSGYHDASKN